MAKPPKLFSNLTRVELNIVKATLGITKKEDINTSILKELKEQLKKLYDSRYQKMISFKMWDVVMCTIIASFAENNTWEEIHDFVVDNYKWFKSFLQMTGGIPTADSYERIIGLINHDELNKILLDYFKTITFKNKNDLIMNDFDGRVNNGSNRKATIINDDKPALNCLNCYSSEYDYCTITEPIDCKTNEIPTIEKIIKKMDLHGVIATWDALNTQTKNIAAVINAGGGYTVPIKANQDSFYHDLIDYFDTRRCDEIRAGNSDSEYYTYSEKSHSSLIKYELYQTSDIKWYSNLNNWKGIKSFGLVKKTITKKDIIKDNNGKRKIKEITTVENRYYISSRFVNIKEFDKLTRGHWNIENKIHWHLDYTFKQDENTTTNTNALLNLEIIHKFVLALLQKVKKYYKDKSLKRIRKHISNNIETFYPEFIVYLILSS